MSHAKYIAVSAAVEKAVRNQLYTTRLPSVQTLARQHNVAIQTMHNALKPLIARGVIRATNHGSFVHLRSAAFSHRVGIFGESDPRDMQMKKLCELALNDGDEPIKLGSLANMLKEDPEFYLHNDLDGYIFLYSNFDLELSKKLSAHNIPALIANDLPEKLGFNSLDYNHRQWLDDAIGTLVAEGCRRIGTIFQRSLNNVISWEEEMATAGNLKREYQLKPYRLIDQLPRSAGEQVNKIFELLMSEGSFPDALIISGTFTTELVRKLRDAGKEPGRDYLLVVNEYQLGNLHGVNIFGKVKHNYEKFAAHIWRRFQELRNDPGQTPQSLFCDKSIDFIKEVISKK